MGQGESAWNNNSYTTVHPFRAFVGGKGSICPTRRLILVDIENYCGKGVLGANDVCKAKSSITEDLSLTDKDLVIVGTSHGANCLTCGVEWRGPRQVLRKGHNGADIALIESVQDYRLETFAAVIIVSGDGIFVNVAKVAKAYSKPVVVAARKESLSRRLALAASVVRYVRLAA